MKPGGRRRRQGSWRGGLGRDVKRTASLRRRFSVRLITRPQYFHASTIITASVTPPATPPAIAPMGTPASPPPEGAGRIDGPDDGVENKVTVTTCPPFAEEGEGVGCCGAMTSCRRERTIGEDGGDGTEKDRTSGGRMKGASRAQ
jgi:hypothetical protein